MVSGVKLSMLLKYEKQSMAQERTILVLSDMFLEFSCVIVCYYATCCYLALAQGSMYIVS